MSERSLVVILNGAIAAEVSQDSRGRLDLLYNDNWQNAPDPTPISLWMPPAVKQHGDAVVRAFLWGLLPDNATILERWASAYQVSANNPFALLSHVGEECAGAAQFVRPERVEALDPGSVSWLDDDQVAERLRRLRTDPAAWQPISDTGQFSLAGAQAKMALLFEDGKWGIPSGSIPTSHILKPAIEGFDDHDLNEHLCLQTARRLGMIAAQSELMEIAGERAIVVRRYDRSRSDTGNALRRVHQEDLCQALGVLPSTKYESQGGPSFARIATLLREYQTSDVSVISAERLLDAAALNWVLVGTDAHAKNYSVLLSGKSVRLAPLYDIASALPYDQFDLEKMKLAMKVGGEYEVRRIVARHWRRHAEDIGLNADRTVERVRDLVVRVPDALAESCEELPVRDRETDLIARLLDRVGEHSKWCVRVLEE